MGGQSTVVLAGYLDVVLDGIVDLGHLDLVVHHVGSEVPVCGHLLQSSCQFVELAQGLLPEVVEVEL